MIEQIPPGAVLILGALLLPLLVLFRDLTQHLADYGNLFMGSLCYLNYRGY